MEVQDLSSATQQSSRQHPLPASALPGLHAMTSVANGGLRWSPGGYIAYCKNNGLGARLVVGCGTARPETTPSSARFSTACLLLRQHQSDFTVDTDAESAPDLVMDLVTYRGSSLGQSDVLGQFDEVEFEPPRNESEIQLNKQHIGLRIDAALVLVKQGGRVVFYSNDEAMRRQVSERMRAHRCDVQEVSHDQAGTSGGRRELTLVEGTKPA